MISLINKLNTSNILNIVKDFRVKNPKIFIAIVATAIIGSLATAIKLITDKMEISKVCTEFAYEPSGLFKVPTKNLNKLKETLKNNFGRDLDSFCFKGFKGNRFMHSITGLRMYSQSHALLNPNLNPNNSKKPEDFICIRSDSDIFEELEGKGFAPPGLKKTIVVLEKDKFDTLMLEKAKEIYGDHGELLIEDLDGISNLQQRVNNRSANNISAGRYYTFLGQFNGSEYYIAIHKNNMDTLE